jgi:site-specific DNA-methyltransferase (adenine-specific)/modification methylase
MGAPIKKEMLSNSSILRPVKIVDTEDSCSLNFYENALFEGDCLDVLKKLPDSCIDMVLCDLPYGTTQNKWDSVIDLKMLWEQYNRVVKPSGAIVLTSQGIFTAKLILSNEKFFKYKLTWEKSKPTNFLNAKKQPLRKHEDVCVFLQETANIQPTNEARRPL